MTDEEFTEMEFLELIAAGATSGLWEVLTYESGRHRIFADGSVLFEPNTATLNDALLAAKCRNQVSGLIAEVRRQREEIAELKSKSEERLKRLQAIGNLIAYNGCDCACDCACPEHADDCEPCLASEISDALGFVSVARDAVPALIAEVIRQREELRNESEKIATWCERQRNQLTVISRSEYHRAQADAFEFAAAEIRAGRAADK